MRIGIDASRANLEQRTGTEWYAFHLTRAFFGYVRPADDVRLYVREPLRPEWGTLPPNVQVRVLRWPPQFLWTQLRLSWELLWHRVDVLFVPAHTVPFLSPRRTVTTLHDVGFMHHETLYGRTALTPKGSLLLSLLVRVLTFGRYGATELDYHRFSATLALKRCQTILTVSEYSKRDICETFKVDPVRVHVIPNAYNAAAFNPAVAADRPRLAAAFRAAGIRPPYIMTIGRIERKKNTLELVRAFAQLLQRPSFASHQLLLVGSPGLGSAEVFAAAETFGIRAKVVHPGWLPEELIPSLMAGAEVFVLPSHFEGFGIPVLEAMAVGTPVVCSNVTALPEVAGGAAELVARDASAIATGIVNVCEHPARATQLRQRGLQRVQDFSWELSAKLLVDILIQ